MAAGALIIPVLLQDVNDLIIQEIGLIMGVDDEMRKLSSALNAIQTVLADAEDKPFGSLSIRNWLSKLNDLAFELEDMLDECATHASKLKTRNPKLRLNKVLFRLKIGRRMKEMAKRLDAVAAERFKFHLRVMPIHGQMEGVAATRHETCQ